MGKLNVDYVFFDDHLSLPTMAKTVLKVKVLECGVKAKDRTSKEYEIDFGLSNTEKSYRSRSKTKNSIIRFESGIELKAQVLANGKLEII